MATDDDLRAELTKALTQFWDDHDGCDWTEASAAHALLPVVRTHLAQAWDDGHEKGAEDGPQPSPNPWREGD